MKRFLALFALVLFVSMLGIFFVIVTNKDATLRIAEVHLADFKVEKRVVGIPITFPGRVNLDAEFNVRSPSIFGIHIVVDLGDLQRKAVAIVSTIKLPSDNCGSFSGNNPVVTLSSTHLDFDRGEAKFHTDGAVAMWDCRENPVPNSSIEMQMKDFGFMKTEVPVPHTWPGSPIKNKLGTQPFSMDAPFGIELSDGAHARLNPGEARLSLDGQYAGITKTILSTFKVDLNGKLNEAISQALDPKVATAEIPKEYLDAGFKLSSASFTAMPGSQNLGLDVKGSVRPSFRLAKEMFRALLP